MRLAIFALALAIPLLATPAANLNGTWEASVVVNEVRIPFRFEINARDGQPSAAFFNGDERVSSTAGSFENDTLTLRFDHYATKLEARFENGSLRGTYGRTNRQYPFEATRFVPRDAESVSAPSIAGLWNVGVKSPKGEQAWRLIVRQAGPEVSAAILRVDGDTGALTGSYRDGKFVLSHFSGARPALLELTLNADGSLDVLQNQKTRYQAVRAEQARERGLPEPADPSKWTSVKDPSEPFRFSGKDLKGNVINESDPRFIGKVVIVSIGGSWCPNCHDEAPFLAQLYREYKSRGLEIVNLSFEEADQLENPTRLRAFIAQYGIEFPVLLGGEPAQVLERLPQAVNLNTWPATFFLGRDGKVRATHAGFAGKASGEEHTKLVAEIRHTVEKLLGEAPSDSKSRIATEE